jgi:hypothetical protein
MSSLAMQQSIWSPANPVFLAYAVTCLVLCLNLMMLWVSSGAIRAKGGLAINPEDGARYGVPVSQSDSPAVARLLRAHRNAEATIYPFLLLGLTCLRTFIRRRLESRRILRRLAQLEQQAIGGAGRDCAADRLLR